MVEGGAGGSEGGVGSGLRRRLVLDGEGEQAAESGEEAGEELILRDSTSIDVRIYEKLCEDSDGLSYSG